MSSLKIAIFSSTEAILTYNLLKYLDTKTAAGEPLQFEIVFFFSDNSNPKVKYYNPFCSILNPLYTSLNITNELVKRKIPVEIIDIDEFYKLYKCDPIQTDIITSNQSISPVNKKDMLIRQEFYKIVEEKLSAFEKQSNVKIDLILLDGYFSIITDPLLKRKILNCHHDGDLTKVNEKGERIYVGFHPTLHAFINEEKYICLTTHFINHHLDAGEIIGVSAPLYIDFERDQKYFDFTLPLNKDDYVKFFSDQKNYSKMRQIEDLYEAYLIVYSQTELALKSLDYITFMRRSRI